MKKARSAELVHENVTPQPTGAGSKFISKSNGTPTTTKFRSSLPQQQQQPQKSPISSMAGDIRIVDQKMPRKTWALQDRSALSVHLLKANLADEGCEEAQLDVAKNLMQESTDDTAGVSLQRENARKAIYWLIRSSEQGNEEATNLLNNCLKSGEGITCQNLSDVRSCVMTPRKEKLVFKAARRLYDKLSNGEEFITTTQIKEYRGTKEEKESHYWDETHILSEDDPNKTFTVEESDNNSPSSKTQSSPGNQQAQAFYTADELHRLVKQDVIKLTRNDLHKVAASYNNGEVPHVAIDVRKSQRYHWNLFSLTNAFLLQFLMLSMFMKSLTFHTVTLVLASSIAVWTAYCLWTWQHRLCVVEDWTTAFKSVLQNNPVVDFTCRGKLILKQILPLFVTSIVCLGALHLLNGPPYIVMALAILTLLGVFLGVMDGKLKWQAGFMLLSTLVASSVFSPIFQKIILMAGSHMQGIETLDFIFKESEFFLPSINFQTAVVVVNLAIIAESYLHTAKVSNVLEQLVVFLWWLKLISTFSSANLYSSYSAVVLTVIVGVTFYLLKSNKDFWKVIAWILMALIFVAIASITHAVISENVPLRSVNDENNGLNYLTWDEYNENCHRKAWKTKSVVETQLDCTMKYECTDAPFFVKWTGKISVIKITGIEKTSNIKIFNGPSAIKDVFMEILVSVDHNAGASEEVSSWPALLSGNSKEKVLSIVSVLITTQHITGIEEKLKTVRRLINLQVGDVVEFHGFLFRGSGGLKPEIGQVKLLRCLNCVASEYEEFHLKTEVLLTTSLLGSVEDYFGAQLIELLIETETAFRNLLKLALKYIKLFSG